MRAGHQDLRSLRGVAHLHDVQLDTVGGLEMLAPHLLAFRQHGVGPSQVDTDVLPDIALHDAGHDILLLFKILVKNDLSLLLAYFL